MARMSEQTVQHLRVAVADPELVGRYWSHVKIGRPDQCWLWTGAISGKGHGRFQIADAHLPQPDGSVRRRTYVVIAHRFGYAALHGVDALLQVPLLAHQCDNPLCQNPICWRESNHRANGQDYRRRRDVVRGASPTPAVPAAGPAQSETPPGTAQQSANSGVSGVAT